MTPVGQVRARFLIAWMILATVLTLIPVAVIWPQWLDGESKTPTPEAISGLAISLLIFAVPALRARKAGLVIGSLYGRLPGRMIPRLAVLAPPMFGAAVVGIYVLFAPLSLAFPEATQAWLFEDQAVLYAAGPPYPWLGNLLGLVAVVIAAPFAEEWFFRGLLLRRWSHKWGPVGGVLMTSLLFGLAHTDILGGLVFGVFMCALYARYRSLWAPSIVHAANNGLAWGLGAVDAHYPIPLGLDTVEQLRAAWWLPAVGLLLVLPLALRFHRQYGAISSWNFAPRPDDSLELRSPNAFQSTSGGV